ncbi:CubicO group peptidase (beta-lactamase class C family) [Algoriphagus boseongensis]|uniref:CubicO group peptidase (Beta-lactamase class C family) n=1 Tax=Algoriphagus boseongensis TaxID=1442587 RepID=A0A4R6T7K6_9BACT|nr:serine hydrolase domain-containing protein [Algoriphagus boseongensis]TDQ18646.1 CubicO group peptidase (beta-lactamase class C family) [Algoriphagus boseongensis]
MNRKILYGLYGLIFWFLIFLGWEWYKSHPKVRLDPISIPKTQAEKIDSILIQSLSDFLIPGISVGIVQNGRVTYLNSFGFQNLASRDSMTIKSQIPVASVSKLFTALSTANYFSETEISPSTSLGEIFSKKNDLPTSLNSLSIAQLLSHKSGLRDSGPIELILRRENQKKLDRILQQIDKPKFAADSFHYADINYDLLGFALQDHSKKPFEELVKETVLEKSGMSSSEFVTSWPQENNSMLGYAKTFLWKRIEPKPIQLERFPSPSSGLVTTPENLAMALVHLGRGPMGDFQKEMDWLKSGSDHPLGFQKIQIDGHNFIGHFGGQAGYSSIFLLSEELEIGFFILTNARDSYDHRKNIASAILSTLISKP